MKPMRSVLLIVGIICASIPGSSLPGRPHETISGRVVAYSGGLACLNSAASWSMVIRVQHPNDPSSKFLRVDFSLPCKKIPEWVSTKPSIQRFRLFRQKSCDDVLLASADKPVPDSLDMALWKYPPGTEGERLPFGQIVPCYGSVDFPLIPVI